MQRSHGESFFENSNEISCIVVPHIDGNIIYKQGCALKQGFRIFQPYACQGVNYGTAGIGFEDPADI